MKRLLLATLLFIPSSVSAHNTKFFEECTRYEIKEKYHEGYYDSAGRYTSGYVTHTKVKVPCSVSQVSNHSHQSYQSEPTYVNHKRAPKCTSGTTLGGLLGGGIAAAVSDTDSYAWTVPLGAVLGAGIGHSGCE